MLKTVKVEVQKVEGEGLVALMGKRVILLCANYFYEGILEGVNDDVVLLSDAGIVYETGPWTSSTWGDRQGFGKDWYVQKSFIESFGLSK